MVQRIANFANNFYPPSPIAAFVRRLAASRPQPLPTIKYRSPDGRIKAAGGWTHINRFANRVTALSVHLKVAKHALENVLQCAF
jgi:hypothetical protein